MTYDVEKFISEDLIVSVYEQNLGNKKMVCEVLGMSYGQLKREIKNNRVLQERLADSDEKIIDLAEGQLLSLVQAKNFQAIKFFLETKGRNRGYDRTLELNVNERNRGMKTIEEGMTLEEATLIYRETLESDENDL